MNEKNKIPDIRFKGFSGEWETREYSKVFTNIPNNTLSRSELNYNFGLAKNVHYGDVLIKFGELLDIEKDEIPFITNNTLANKFKSAKLQNGDVIIADAAEDETVGKCTELVNVGEEIIFSGLHTIPIRPTLSFASKYLGYYMNSSAYHNQLLPLMQGTKVLSISKSAIQNTTIYSPNNSLEQTKIGNYFQQLDKLINLHQRKYDKLLKVKKAMLEKMFPKNGADVPEIRFKGFIEKWEEKKLGECVLIQRGGSPRPIENFITDDKNGINWIKIGDVSIGSRYITKTKEKIIPEGEKHSRKVQKGDLILSNSMSFGRPYIMAIDGCIHDGWLLIRDEKEIFDLEYLLQLLSSDYMLNQYRALASGGVVINLNSELVQSTNIFVPNKKEQTQIGNFFKNLDNLLTLHQKELEKLKNIKKACLEKMFV